MRGLLVTPWFAAGAGFVIAAALALNSPHAVLTYRPNTQNCRLCKQGTPAEGSLTTVRPGVQLKSARPAQGEKAARSSGGGSAVGVDVGFRVVWRRDGQFGAIITIPASQAAHGWSLRFDIPGTRITQVWGAQWQPAANGQGGVASVPAPRPRKPGFPGRQGNPGHHHGPGHSGWPGSGGHGQSGARGQLRARGQLGSRGHLGSQGQPGSQGQLGSQAWAAMQESPAWWGPQDVRFLVTAQGSPVTPVDCVLNQASCHFG
jgi:hypothetical protein